MKRVIIILVVTLVGLGLTFIDAFYGLLLYTWYSFASPLELTYGMLAGSRLSLIVAAAVVGATVFQRRALFARHIICFYMALFLFACMGSLASQMTFSMSYIAKELELIIKLLAMTALAPLLIDSVKKLRWYISTIAVSVALLASYYGFFGLLAGSTSIRGQSRIGDNNGYAVFLLSCLPFIFFSLRHIKLIRNETAKSGIQFTLFSGCTLATLLTFSRGGFIALLAVLFLTLLSVRSLATRLISWFLVLPFSLLIVWNIFSINPDLIALPPGAASSESIVTRTLSSYTSRLRTLRYGYEEISSANSRLHFWKTAFLMFKDNPVFGVGLRKYPRFYDEYDTTDGEYGKSRAVHSTLFSILAETGSFGFASFWLIILGSLLAQSKAKGRAKAGELNTEDAEEIVDYVRMLRISMLGFAIGSLLVNCLYQEILWAMVSISIALDLISKRLVDESQQAI